MKSTDLLNQCAAAQPKRGKQYDANQTAMLSTKRASRQKALAG